jgi:hypothetical protein
MERRVEGCPLLLPFSMERVVRRGSPPMESSLLSFSFVLPILYYLLFFFHLLAAAAASSSSYGSRTDYSRATNPQIKICDGEGSFLSWVGNKTKLRSSIEAADLKTEWRGTIIN